MAPYGSPAHDASLQLAVGIAHIEAVFPPREHHDENGGRDPRYCCLAVCNETKADCDRSCDFELNCCTSRCVINHPTNSPEYYQCSNECHLWHPICHHPCSAGYHECRSRCF